jgi:hypothetical protein
MRKLLLTLSALLFMLVAAGASARLHAVPPMCTMSNCIVGIDGSCECEWVRCIDGTLECGVPPS